MSQSKNGYGKLTGSSLRLIGLTLVIAAAACGGPAAPSAGDEPTEQSSTTTAPQPTTTGPAPATSTTTTSMAPAFTKTTGLDYTTKRTLDVYAPTEPAGWPVVVVVHGLNGVRGQFARFAEIIAAEGAVVFNISTKFSVPPIDGIDDISCAIRFARATAADYGGDPTSITLVGYSSGAAKGSIVAMDGDAYNRDCVVSDGSALPTAFVGFEGPFNYGTHLYGTFRVPQLKDEDPVMWEAVDPYSHIGGNGDLIVRLIHGRDADLLPYDVPAEVSSDFHDALAAAGYDVAVTYLEGATHGSLRPGTETFDATIQLVLETVGI